MERNSRFNQFILDAYELSLTKKKNESVLGTEVSFPAIIGRIYIGNSSPTFQEIAEHTNIKEKGMKQFLESIPATSPEMVSIKVRGTDEAEDIYEWSYISHQVEEHALLVETQRGVKRFSY